MRGSGGVNSFRQRWLLIITLLILSALVVASLRFPQAIGPLALLGLACVVLERLRLEQALLHLAHRLDSGRLDAKLEVGNDALGRLHQAVNSLLQQQRRVQREQRLLPTLSPHTVSTLLDVAESGPQPWPAVILLVGTNAEVWATLSAQQQLATLEALTAHAQPAADYAQALLERCGHLLTLSFGMVDHRPLTVSLAAASQCAQRIRATCANQAADYPTGMPLTPLTFSLGIGNASAAIIAGTGFSIASSAFDQAMQLYYLAPASNDHLLLCSADTYRLLHPRSPAWQQSYLHLTPPGQPPQAVYTLKL
jgi:HAMP domain-containing protein